MTVKEWEKFREEAIEAYENLPAENFIPKRPGEIEALYENLPLYSGEGSSYRADAAARSIECPDPAAFAEATNMALAFAIRDRFGVGMSDEYYMGRFSDGRPIFFAEMSLEKKGVTYERIRLQVYLEYSVRNKTITLYPRLCAYQENLRNRYLLWAVLGTIVGTYFFHPLPFIMLALRGIAPLWRKHIWNIRGDNPRDRWQVNPLNPPRGDNDRLVVGADYFMTWSKEHLEDFQEALNSLYRTISNIPSQAVRRPPVTIPSSEDDDHA